MDATHLNSLGLPFISSFPAGAGNHAAPTAATCTQTGPSTAAVMPPPEVAPVAAPKVGTAAAHEGAYIPPPLDAPPPGPPSIDEKSQALAAHLQRSLAVRSPEQEVSIVSFNMLLKGFDRKFYYPSVGPELRHWPFRKEQLKQLLFGMGADVYCMQEVECLTFSEEFTFLAEGGYGSVAPKDDSKGKYPDMAKTAIFYREDRLEKVWEDHRSRIVLAAFRHWASGQLLYVASCHLEGAPSEAATRFTQCRKALESIQRNQQALKVDPAECAVAFAGDFNETDEGAVCHCLRNGGIMQNFRTPSLPDVEITKVDFSHDFQLSDLYSSGSLPWSVRPDTFCAPPEVTAAWGNTPSFGAVDFIFYSRRTLQPIAIREPFSAEQVKATASIGIPAAWHFSDHVPIGAIFKFVNSEAEQNAEGASVEVI